MDKSQKLQAARASRVATLNDVIAGFQTDIKSPGLSDHARGRNSGMAWVARQLAPTIGSGAISDRDKIRHATKIVAGISSNYMDYILTNDEFMLGRAKGMVEAAHSVRQVLHSPAPQQ